MDEVNSNYPYDLEFQVNILRLLVSSNNSLTAWAASSICSEYFDDDVLAIISSYLLDYHKEYSSPPAKSTLITYIKSSNSRKVLDNIEAILQTINDIYDVDIQDEEYTEDVVYGFHRYAMTKNALLSSVDDLARGNVDKVLSKIDEVRELGDNHNIDPVLPFEDSSWLYHSEETQRYSILNAPVLDRALGGGIARGEMLLFVAPPGAGKTTLLINAGVSWVSPLCGLKVLHITTEVSKSIIAQRYAARLAGKYRSKEKLVDYIDVVNKSAALMARGRLAIEQFPPDTASPADLRNYIYRFSRKIFVPDAIIVDYPDLLRSDSGYNSAPRFALGSIYKQLRAIAVEPFPNQILRHAKGHSLIMAVASQSHRSTYGGEYVGGEHVSEAFEAKMGIPDMVLSMAATPIERKNNLCRISIEKNRNAGSWKTEYRAKYNSDSCAIIPYEEVRGGE